MFLGEYQHTLDAKGRVSLPAKFRSEAGENLVLAKGIEDCIYVYRAEDYRAFVEELLQRPDFDPKVRRVRRQFTTQALETDVDKTGRVSVPPFLREHARLAGKVAVVGNGDRIELWDSEVWSHYNEQAAETVESDAEAIAGRGVGRSGALSAPES